MLIKINKNIYSKQTCGHYKPNNGAVFYISSRSQHDYKKNNTVKSHK